MAVVLEEAIEQLREHIEAGVPRLALQAPPGFGKTTVLDGLAASLATRRRIVRIGLPEGDDAALVALVEAAMQLGFAMPTLLDRVVPRHEPARVPWATKLAALREALTCAGDDLLILIDEPRFDPALSPGGELFAGRAVEITETLLGAHGTVVLAGTSIPHGLAEDAGIRLPLLCSWHDIAWNAVAVVMEEPPPHRPLPPVVVQVLRVLRSAGVDTDRIPARDLRLDRLVTNDLGRIFLESAEMRRIVARLAVLRVPFPNDFLERAGFMALSERDRGIVDRLLLRMQDGVRVIPAALSQAIRARIAKGDPAWVPDEPAGDAHRFAAQHHGARFASARTRGDVAAAVREELEEIHQLTEAGDAAALLARSLQFVEQYDALGKSLSQKALRAREGKENLHREAVRAYERALEHDDRDAYAHHYIAYNLDILGTEPERVEREYVAARELERKHAWYHSRYVCFLITTAWMNEAHAAWERTLVDLDETGGPLRPLDYKELHAQVARLLLERSRLDFAAEVLEDVPDELQGELWWRALMQLRVCLEEDRDDRLVFPPTLALEKRWQGPHLAASGPDEPEVVAWKPGRVLGCDEDGVLLCVAEPGGRVTSMNLDARALEDEWNGSLRRLRVDTFVELIDYADGRKEMLLWDRASSSFDAVPALPKLFPSPARYIRRGFAGP